MSTLIWIWKWYKDDWLVTRQAAILFLISSLAAVSLTPVFFGKVDTATMSFWARLPWGILGIVGPIALFFLYFGMWRYWVCIDDSRKWAKRATFLLLLLGLWWGSCLYCWCVYFPQALRQSRVTT